MLAVAAFSLVSAMDLEARVRTYTDTVEFLRRQSALLADAATTNEFATLAIESESLLLGEMANWYARRLFTDVA